MFKLYVISALLISICLARPETSSYASNASSPFPKNVTLPTYADLPTVATVNLTNDNSTQSPTACLYVPGQRVDDRATELECCGMTVGEYEYNWGVKFKPLTRYLETLKVWECPQFEIECEDKLFDFTDFTKLVYEYYCDYENFVEQCIDQVNQTVTSVRQRTNANEIDAGKLTAETMASSSGNTSIVISQWKGIISMIRQSQMTLDELLIPCIQVAQYDLEETHDGYYQEIINVGIPTCSLSWCGFSGDTLNERIISAWTCLSSRCRASMIVIMVVCGLLGLAITIVNITVIAAITKNVALQNSQSIYKISLAVADLLVGMVVLPTCINNLTRLLLTRHEHVTVDDSALDGTSEATGQFQFKFPKSYRDSVGFFTAISIFVSVYTLAGAGFDRLNAVFRPLSYRKERAKLRAKRMCVASWIIAIILGILPFFIKQFPYGLILSFLITNIDQKGLILYTVCFIIPLLVVWVVNIATYHATKRHSKFRRQLTMAAQKKSRQVENRLARTLGLMVGVFTVNTLPLVILLVCSMFFPTLYFTLPRLLNVEAAHAYITIEFVATMLLLSNSLWNFFIYSVRNLEFRVAVKSMYKAAADKTGLSSCWDGTVLCMQRAAYNGRRRLSSLPNLSYSTRKKSSATSTTRMSSGNMLELPSVFGTSNALSTDPVTTVPLQDSSLTQQSSSSQGTRNQATRNMSSTYIKSENSSSKSQKTKKAKRTTKRAKKEEDKEEGSMAGDDTFLRSFAIDANADRLFLSVMENIDEAITPAGSASQPNVNENSNKKINS